MKTNTTHSNQKMSVSVIIITLNEFESIGQVLKELPRNLDEILVVDGYSSDGTPELVKSLGYEVIMQQGKGYGAAFLTGIKKAKGDVLVLMDGDGSHNPADIPRLLEKVSEGYDAVFGSRYLPGSGSEDDTIIRYFGNKVFTYFTNLVHHVGISDSLYLFAAIRREVFERIKLSGLGFEFCVEVPIKVHLAGFKIAEVPCFERKRFYGKSRVNAFFHGLRILWMIIKIKFSKK